jgi:hypothetical protein
MSKIIDSVTANWFQEVAPRDFYIEEDLERVIILNLELIFPQFKAFALKQNLLNPNTGKFNKPDLGMVKSDYSEWYIIEVELGKHNLPEVLKQIQTFRSCTFTAIHANYIHQKRPDLDIALLTPLVTGRLPEVMVIVNEQKEDWKNDLVALNCKMCVFQIYNDFQGRRMYRLDGEHPFIATNFCNCKYEKQVPYAVKILRSDFLDGYGITNGNTLTIEYNGINNLWERHDSGNEVFLICKTTQPPLDPLMSRYRLNFNTVNFNRTIQPNFLGRLFNNRRRVNAQNINTFSFTKD